MGITYKEQAVWPLAVRLIHWVLVLTFLVLFVTGWLMGSGQLLNEEFRLMLAERLHAPAGQIAGVALLGRLVLLFMPGITGWRALVPGPSDREGLREMFLFYLSFGRRQVPAFFAHDPLWKTAYLLLFAVIAAQVITGLAMEFDGLRFRLGASAGAIRDWHVDLGIVLAWVTGLHIVSVILREIRARGFEVSAMLHGTKMFRIEKPDTEVGQVKVEIAMPLRSRGPQKTDTNKP
jgi:Ni/Fe-hydrogenase 1 B-type cytochrome subunit